MNKFFITAAAAVLTAGFMTGCISTDDSSNQYHEITAAERTEIMNNISGSYTGKLQYYDPETETVDSLDASWVIRTDSTVTVKYPVSFLKKYVDQKYFLDAYETIANAPAQEIPLKIYLGNYVLQTYWEKYWQQGDYPITMGTLETDHSFTIGDHTFDIVFKNTYISFYDSYYYPSIEYYKGKTTGYILLDSFIYDGQEKSVNAPSAFLGKK